VITTRRSERVNETVESQRRCRRYFIQATYTVVKSSRVFRLANSRITDIAIFTVFRRDQQETLYTVNGREPGEHIR